MGLLKKLFGQSATWSAQMGWRYVAYFEGEQSLSLSIEPMVNTPDWVYVPDEASWQQSAPDWAKDRRDEILARLKSMRWNRQLIWKESEEQPISAYLGPVSGSLESTPGGQDLESRRFFDPKSPVTPDMAHQAWEKAARLFAEGVRGKINIYQAGDIIPSSVFQLIELPALQANPQVDLVIRKVGDSEDRE